MELRVRNVSRKSRRVKEIYLASFPKKERMPFWSMRLMAKMTATRFWEFSDGDTVCGFAYLGMAEGISFLMFLAVDPSLRSRGYGGRILEEIRRRCSPDKILVSIERCAEGADNLSQRRRRREFYLRNGYEPTGFCIELSGVEQEILIRGGVFDPDEFAAFFKAYSNGTMHPRIWREEADQQPNREAFP